MSFETRRSLIKTIEAMRGSTVICYVTSLRPGVPGLIADDAVREFIDHLQRAQPLADKIDLFLVSNGGDSVTPWRLAPIIREFTDYFSVLVPYKAYSAATIMALGANEIVMHKFGALGPIDPTVMNEFNPIETKTNRPLGISVEDVKAYISFIKETVGIRQEHELARAIELLVDRVHPLALGNVERFFSQAKLLATKMLALHASEDDRQRFDFLVDALTSKLYFHGHPINRVEAKELGLKLPDKVPKELETAMWSLFVDFEREMKFRDNFDPVAQLFARESASARPGEFTQLASFEEVLTWSVVESRSLSSRYDQRMRYTLTADPQLNRRHDSTMLGQQWSQVSPAGAGAPGRRHE